MTADSDGVLPAWLPVSAPRIDPDRVPHSLENPTASGVLWQASRDALLMEIPDVARLVVTREGLTLAPMVDIPLKTLGPVLRQTPLAALCWFHGFFARQGVALAGPDGAVVILGGTVTGKSTLAAMLMQQGLKLLSDDLVALSLSDEETVRVMPLWPEMVLWPDTIELVFPEGPPSWLAPRMDHPYGAPCWDTNAGHFQNSPVELKGLYYLQPERASGASWSDGASAVTEQVSATLLPYHGAIGAALGAQRLAVRYHKAVAARTSLQIVRIPCAAPSELAGVARMILAQCEWNGHG